MQMIKKLSILLVFSVILIFTSCNPFGPKIRTLEDNITIEINDEKDNKYFEIDAPVGEMCKLEIIETTSAGTHEKSVLMVSFFDNKDDFWGEEVDFIYNISDDESRTRIFYFVPTVSPFYIKVDPFLDFYGEADISINKNLNLNEVIVDGESHSYTMQNNVIDMYNYILLEMPTTSGKTYSFDFNTNGHTYVYDDSNNEISSTIFDEFDVVANSDKVFVLDKKSSGLGEESEYSVEFSVIEN